jgi:hypothetical protein
MWGAISVLVEFVCLATAAVIWIRMAALHRRHGMRIFTTEPWLSVPKQDRRPLRRAIQRGEPLPLEYRDVAREWAKRELMRRGIAWQSTVMIPLLAVGVPSIFDSPGPLWRVGFWFSLAGLCLLVASAGLLWRDQRVAARVFRDTAPTA